MPGAGAGMVEAVSDAPTRSSMITLLRSATFRATITSSAALVAAAAGLLPWHRSGDAVRNGFAIVSSAHRLGFASEGAAAAVAVVWFLVPAIAVASATVLVLGSTRLAGLLAAVAGAAAAAVATVVLLAPGATVVGPTTTLLAGLTATVGGIAAVFARRRTGTHERSAT